MTGSSDRQGAGPARADPLQPLRTALLDAARRDAAAAMADAEQKAADELAEARRTAETILAEARQKGRKEAEAVASAERGRASREARARVMAARREAYEQLCDRSRAAVRRLREDPRYPALLEALRARAADELGAGAALSEHPSGGIVGSVPGRTVVHSLDELADEAVAALGPRVEELWSP